MKHLFSSETWSNMRTLLAILLTLGILLCLLLAGCTPEADDDVGGGRGTGIALSLGSVTVAEQKGGKQGTDTRAGSSVDGLEQWPGFQSGDMLYVGIASEGGKGMGSYTYSANGSGGSTWKSSDLPAYWQSGGANNTVQIASKAASANYTLPDSYEADATGTPGGLDAAAKWHAWDVLTYRGESMAPTSPYSCELQHAMAQLCVELVPGTEIEQSQLQSATVEVPDADCEFSISLTEGDGPLQKRSGTTQSITLLKNGATSLKHYALLLPGQTYDSAKKMIEISLDGKSYYFTPTEVLTLKAGECLHLTLTISKTGVSGWTVSSTGWDNEVTTGGSPEGDPEIIVIEATPGGLGTALSGFNGTKLMITGEINDADMEALKSTINTNKVTEVYIMATGVKDIKSKAFDGCETLESVSMPKVTGSIGNLAFNGCKALKSISMPKVTGSIEYYTFYDCKALESVSLPEVTGGIDNRAFYGCETLESVSMPKAAGSIGNSAFQSCKALKSISMPEVTGDIGIYAFQGCEALESVSLPKVTGSIGGYTFQGCEALESVSLPEVTGGIEDSAFDGCKALKSISMPKAAAGIGYDAFNGCKSLESVSLPKVTSIREDAFQSCTSLESIVLSGYDLNQSQVSLPTVGSSVFMDCPVSILFLRDVPKEIDANTVVVACQSWADVNWKAIHYDYDDLNDDTDVGSYSGHWLRP